MAREGGVEALAGAPSPAGEDAAIVFSFLSCWRVRVSWVEDALGHSGLVLGS